MPVRASAVSSTFIACTNQSQWITRIRWIVYHIHIPIEGLWIGQIHAAHVGIGGEPAALGGGELAEPGVFEV